MIFYIANNPIEMDGVEFEVKYGKPYLDTTTGRLHARRYTCEICGLPHTTPHHKVKRQWCKRLEIELVEDEQMIFWLCLDCHSAADNMSKERFLEKYGKEKNIYLYDIKG